ncbi:MAG: DUF1566 domain-containing protein [Campylobacterota bacterium]|nr:DUF1566 domain-containing protein [Campylobacterota bacterium]
MLFKYILLLLPIMLLSQDFIVDINITDSGDDNLSYIEKIDIPLVIEEKPQEEIIWHSGSADSVQKNRYEKIIRNYLEDKYPLKVQEYKNFIQQEEEKEEARLLKEKKLQEEYEESLKKQKYIKKHTLTIDNLMWQDDLDSDLNTNTWSEADNYCQALHLVSFDNWRLPTDKELKTLLNNKQKLKYKLFKSHWSSTKYISNSRKSWVIDMSSGKKICAKKIDNFYYRCVRNF